MKHVILFIALSASPARGTLAPQQWVSTKVEVVRFDAPVIDPVQSWLYVVPQAGQKYPNIAVTFTIKRRKK